MTRDLIYAMHICDAAARHTQISFFVEHINDEMKSFYMLTPGFFALEFGYEGMQVGEDWETTHNTEASIWGHKWQG